MEKLKAKHDHKLTDVLKVGIFALFLLMPFLTFMPTALYYGFNKYAVNETSTQVDIQYKYQSNEVNSVDDLDYDKVYHYDTLTIERDNGINIDIDLLNYENANFNQFNMLNTESYLNSLNDIIVNLNTDGTYITLYIYLDYDNDTYLDYESDITWQNDLTLYNVDFIINDLHNFKDFQEQFWYLPSASSYNVIESVDVQTDVQNTISQQMYNSWQSMWQSPFYTWTNQSVLKTGLDNFTSVFGVSNNSYITNLLTYELIIVAIYIVIDIVITLFTWLTHLFNKE